MRHLILKELHLENFQKFKNQTFEFGERVTNVYAPNRGGKTTIYSAMTWLLFGKDCFGRTDTGRGAFDIKRLEDGKKIDHTDVCVEGVYLLDGSPITFKRVLQENWTKGKDSYYKGDETKCFINDIPKTITEYNAEVYNILNEDEFRMITNIGNFLSLKTEYQRNYLCAMAGVRCIEDICKDNPAWLDFIKEISGKKLEEYRKQLSFQKSELEKRYEKIGPSIESLQKTKPEPMNWEELEFEKEGLQALIDQVNESLSDAGKQDELKNKEIAELRKKSSEKRKLFFDLTNKAQEERQKIIKAEKDKLFEKDNERISINNKIKGLKQERDNVKLSVTSLEAKYSRLDSELWSLLDDYNKLNKSVFESSVEATICPLLSNHRCNSSELLAYMEDNRKKAESNFNVGKEKKLSLILSEGNAKKQEKEKCESQITEEKEKIENIDKQLEATETVLNSMPVYHQTSLPVESSLSSPIIEDLNKQKIDANAEIAKLDKLIEEKQSASKVDNSELTAKRSELNKQLEAIIIKLAVKSQIEKIEKDISGYDEEGRKLANTITELENKEFTAKEINRALVQDATDRVNKLFSLVNWQMFELQKNGLYAEVCKATINGVSQSLNTELQVNAGIDIVNTISRLRGISAPLFVDNHESVNNAIPAVGQVINLFVAPQDTELTIKIIE